MEIVLSFIVGSSVGAVFALAGAQAPAPNSIAGVMGVVGITVGWIVLAAVRNHISG
jgi:XapX domain-containing protein